MGEMAEYEMERQWSRMFQIDATVEWIHSEGRELEWRTLNEGVTQVKRMNNSHLHNCIKLLNRRIMKSEGTHSYNEAMIEVMENEIEDRKNGLVKQEQ